MATFEKRNTTREAQESIFYERCWRCRAMVPNGLVRRRTMRTGYSKGTLLGTGAAVADLDHYEKVSLCGVCYDELAAREKARLEKSRARAAWVCRFLGILFGIRFLNLVFIPLPLGAVSMLIFARLRIVGRALLIFWIVTVVVRVLEWEPHRHPERVGMPWAVLTSGLVLWRIWTADSLLWPFGWLARKRHPHLAQQTRTESPTPLTIGGPSS